MGSLKTIVVVLSLLLAPMLVLENEGCVQDTEQDISNQNSPTGGNNPSLPQTLTLPSTIKIWEAWAKGFATISQATGATYVVINNGSSNVLIDEYVMLMSPSPANPSEDEPDINDETQDGVLTI